MDYIPKNRILDFRMNTLQEVRKEYKLDADKTRKAVEELQQWINNEADYAKKDFGTQFLENTIISCKGNMDNAKKRFDNYYTMRQTSPRFFKTINVLDLESLDTYWVAPMPQLTDDNYRVVLVRLHGDKFTKSSLSTFFKLGISLLDYLRIHDYSNGVIAVADYSDVSVYQLISTANLSELREGFRIIMEGFGLRVAGVHIITSSRLVHALVAILKSVMSKKVSNRIMIHKDLDSLHAAMPKEILSKDYGGRELPLGVLSDNTINELSSSDNVKYLRDMMEACNKTNSYQ